MAEGESNAKNSTATGGDDEDDELPDVNVEDSGRKQILMNTI